MGMHSHFRCQQGGAEALEKGLWVALGNKIEVRRIRPNTQKRGRIPGVHFN